MLDNDLPATDRELAERIGEKRAALFAAARDLKEFVQRAIDAGRVPECGDPRLDDDEALESVGYEASEAIAEADAYFSAHADE